MKELCFKVNSPWQTEFQRVFSHRLELSLYLLLGPKVRGSVSNAEALWRREGSVSVTPISWGLRVGMWLTAPVSSRSHLLWPAVGSSDSVPLCSELVGFGAVFL